MAGQVAADHHFHLERFAHQTHGGHRIDLGDLPVRNDVSGLVEEAGCDLVEHLSLAGNALGQDDVERGDAVGDYEQDVLSVDVIDVPDFSDILGDLSREVEIGVGDSFHFSFRYSFS